MRIRLARFLQEEAQWAARRGPFWDQLSPAQKKTWLDEADRYLAHLAERGLGMIEIEHGG